MALARPVTAPLSRPRMDAMRKGGSVRNWNCDEDHGSGDNNGETREPGTTPLPRTMIWMMTRRVRSWTIGGGC